MPSKEEILEIADDLHSFDIGGVVITKKAAIHAMDEWARTIAIGFSNWAAKEGWESAQDGIWQHWESPTSMTTEQLFDRYPGKTGLAVKLRRPNFGT